MYKIKEKPEDFVVKEILNLNKKKKGKYSYFLLKKKNWNTLDLVKKLSKKLNRDVKYAGLKDKQAVTEQYVSVEGVKEIKFNIKDVSIRKVGEGDEPIILGGLDGNKFEIVVRNLDSKKNLKINKIENYFDKQRFSEKNVEVGLALLKRNYSKLIKLLNLKNKEEIFRYDKKILKFVLNSFQSYVFNLVLKEVLEKKIKIKKLPLINFDTEFENKEIEKTYCEILERDKIKKEDFIFREMPFLVSESKDREIFIKVEDFKYRYSKDGSKFKCVLKFKLSKGSYGTLVVKKLFG
ncbi:MAG: hypothetical protein CMH64_01515 [Nanoarchaeota archaeon]|nr:hypothetical protein [Nanoarchaeota archaeon]|tara:strand:+ start:275 stop:1153 length:879 start_codon:yes stop_codon:yes gene_type:complete